MSTVDIVIAGEQITIEAPAQYPEGQMHVSIYNMLGKMVQDRLINELPATIDIRSLPEGIYLCTLWNDMRRIGSARLVVVR